MNKAKFSILLNEKRFNSYSLKANNSPNLNSKAHLMRNNSENLNASNAEADVMFLTDSINGNKFNDYNFTDLLTEKLYMAKVPDAFEPILDNPNSLNKNISGIDFNFNNGDRIKKIFSNVITSEKVEKYDSLFYETAIKGNKYKVTEKDCFRAFMIYVSMPDAPKEKNKNILIVFLLDPYHLVCPVPFNGKTREEVAKKVFQDKKNYINTFEQNFKNKFGNIKFIEKEIL